MRLAVLTGHSIEATPVSDVGAGPVQGLLVPQHVQQQSRNALAADDALGGVDRVVRAVEIELPPARMSCNGTNYRRLWRFTAAAEC